MCKFILQPVRKTFGRYIVITSGKRSEVLNKAVGGVPTSDHLWVLEEVAVDFRFENQAFNKAHLTACFERIHSLYGDLVGQVILYRNPDKSMKHIHLSMASKRHQGEFMYKNHGEPYAKKEDNEKKNR